MRAKEEIEAMNGEAADAVENPKFQGMTYEEGVLAALDWVLENDPSSDGPLSD